LLDFFKPNTADLERVKAVKKNRHGRRVKQLEKIEQKMKEERQKRIRERQKEFFADIESHRLGDYLGSSSQAFCMKTLFEFFPSQHFSNIWGIYGNYLCSHMYLKANFDRKS
jgi:hypothetical protein